MNIFKNRKVILRPTNQKTNVGAIIIRPSDNKMAIVNDLTLNDPQPIIHQNLFIVSDEFIKEGDWVYNSGTNEIYKFVDDYVVYERKIIASTTELVTLPKIPLSFIEIYVTHYNNNIVIDNVLVEYEIVNDFGEPYSFDDSDFGVDKVYKLKVKLDNTINMKIKKQTFTRNEVETIYKQGRINAYKEIKNGSNLSDILDSSNRWINDNL